MERRKKQINRTERFFFHFFFRCYCWFFRFQKRFRVCQSLRRMARRLEKRLLNETNRNLISFFFSIFLSIFGLLVIQISPHFIVYIHHECDTMISRLEFIFFLPTTVYASSLGFSFSPLLLNSFFAAATQWMLSIY